ncbi:hypothetical protein [Motiliproteus sp. SC1-56]|nr:hypothetical protein [Motiliproteus sp. SC1-56]
MIRRRAEVSESLAQLCLASAQLAPLLEASFGAAWPKLSYRRVRPG